MLPTRVVLPPVRQVNGLRRLVTVRHLPTTAQRHSALGWSLRGNLLDRLVAQDDHGRLVRVQCQLDPSVAAPARSTRPDIASHCS